MKFPKLKNPLDYIYPSRESIRKYMLFCEKHVVMMLSVITVLTAASVVGTLHLYGHVDTSLTALLPDYYQSVKTLNQIDQEGAKISEMVILEGENTHELVDYARGLQQKLEKEPLVHQVKIKRDKIPTQYAMLVLNDDKIISIRDRIKKKIGTTAIRKSGLFVSLDDDDAPAKNADPKVDLSLADIKEQIPGIFIKEGTNEEYTISADQKLLIVTIFPKYPPSNLVYTEKFYEVLRGATDSLTAQHPNVKPSFFGSYRKRLDEYQLIKKEANLIGTFTMIAVIVAVALYFRQVLPVVVINLPLAIGLFWTMGVTDLIVGKLNTITAFLVGILGGLGVDFCIYLYSRYLEERREGVDRTTALVDAVSQTGRAAFTAGLNTAFVFFSLTLADFRGFSEFGLISAVGLLLCYLAIYLLLPAFIIWFEKLGWLKIETSKTFFGIPWPKLPPLIPEKQLRFPLAKTLVGFAVAIVVAFAVIVPHLEFEYDFGKLKSDLISYDREEALLKRFGYNQTNRGGGALLVMNSRDDIEAAQKAVQKKIDSDKDSPTLSGFSSFYTIWPPPEVQQRRMKLIAEIRSLMDNKAIQKLKGNDREHADELMKYLDVKPYPIEEVPKNLANIFSPRQGPLGAYAYVLARSDVNTKDGRDAMKFAADAREVKTERGTFFASSQEIVFADILGLMLHESRLTILIAILIISVSVWFDFWSIPKSLLVLVPVFTGTMLTMVLLYCFGGKITFYNMIVIPMILGMGEDSAVHLYHRYTEEGRGKICKTMKTTGKAVWMAAATNILGFVGLVFSHHRGLQSIGFLAAAGLLSCLVCSLLILPAIVQVLEDFLPDFPGHSEHAKAEADASAVAHAG